MTLTELDPLAKQYSDWHHNLAEAVAKLEDELREVRKRHLPKIRSLVGCAKERRAKLEAGVASSPETFVRPRTAILHGIEFGYRKQKGGLQWADDAEVVARIYKLFGEPEAAGYLHIKQTPDKKALDKLDVCRLRKLGIELVADSDKVVCKAVDSEVEKLVEALLKGEPEEAEAAR